MPKKVLTEKKYNFNSENIPIVQLTKPTISGPQTAEDNEFIAELLSTPLLNNATCSTAKIFAPRTKEMDTGFLMPVDDTLIISKEEPEDLTHLAPVAGDESVPLDVPLLEDLLATLDEASFSFIDPNSDEIPRFDLKPSTSPMNQEVNFCMKTSGASDHEPLSSKIASPLMLHSASDPPMLHSPGSSILSPYQNNDSPSSEKSNSDLYSPPAPLNQIEDPLFSERLVVTNTPSPGPFTLNLDSPPPEISLNSTCPAPSFTVSPPLLYDNLNEKTGSRPTQVKPVVNSPW